MNKTTETLLEGSGSSFSLSSLLDVVVKRLWLILAIVLIVPLIVGFVVAKQPPVYQATASIIIDSTVPQYLGQSFKDVVDVETNWWSAQELLQTELKVLKSYKQAEATVHALCDMKVHPPGEPGVTVPGSQGLMTPDIDCSKPDDIARATGLVQGVLAVMPVRESRVVNLTVEFHQAEMAARLANTAARVYITRNLERRLSQSEDAATWLGDEYGDLTNELNTAERALIEYKKKNNVVAISLEDQQNDLSNRRKKLSDELSQIQVKLISAKATREQFAALQSDNPMEDLRPGIIDNAMLLKLKSLYLDEYARVIELRGKYLEKHPVLTSHEERLSAIKGDLQHEAKLAQKSLEAQYATLTHQERDLKSALDATTQEALRLEQKAIEYNRLKRSFDRLIKVSEQVGGRERESSLAQHLKTNNIRPLDEAQVPGSAVAAHLVRSVLVALLLSLVMGIGLAFVLEMLDSTVKSQEDVEKAAGLVFLGLIPKILPSLKPPEPVPLAVQSLVKAGSTDLYVLAHPRSSVAECCRAIRTNILFMTPDTPPTSLLITSAGPREGKTTTAVNLAITMAQSGLKTLIIDTDMRRPRLHKAFGLPSTPDGISRAILGECEVMSVVRETGVPNLWLLPCGALPPNPAELLHAARFKVIKEELHRHFDRLIFDSPPVGAVTDAAILSRMTSGTVLVAKSGATSKDTLALLAKRLFADGSVNVLGCILNDLDLDKQTGKGYYQYYAKYGYYGSYGDDVDKGDKKSPSPESA